MRPVGYGLEHMCGRYVSASSPQDIANYFGATSVAETLVEPNYNVAPTAQVTTIRARDGERQLDIARWGLIPSWAKSKSIGAKMINARSETVKSKNAFRVAAKRRRCIVPADAFYEWTAVTPTGGAKPKKQPWCIVRTDGDMFAFAGLYEVWRDPEEELEAGAEATRIYSCTVLTRPANEAMSRIHDRMPVMLAPHYWDRWLDRDDQDSAALLASIEPVPSELLHIYPVSTAVNNSRSRGVELLDPAEPLTPESIAAESLAAESLAAESLAAKSAAGETVQPTLLAQDSP